MLYNAFMAPQKPPRLQLNSGVFYEIQVRGRLILRLMFDGRINIFYKLIPIAAVIYVISPFDIPGPFDDIAVFLFGMYLFIEICPPKIVQEHLNQIHGISDPPPYRDEDIIDGEFKNLDDPDEPGNPR